MPSPARRFPTSRMHVVGFITQAPVIRKILDHIGRRFDPLKLPGRSPPLWDDFCPDPSPDYGPQFGDRGPDLLHLPLTTQHPTCAWISGCITSRGEYTDEERPPDAAAGGVTGSLMSGRSVRLPKLDGRIGFQDFPTIPGKKEIPICKIPDSLLIEALRAI